MTTADVVVKFERIGRHRDVAELTVPAPPTDEQELVDRIAEAVRRHARRYLGSKDYEVDVSSEGTVSIGWGRFGGGTWTLTLTGAPLRLGSGMTVTPGPDTKVWTSAEFEAELRSRFGDDITSYAFVCPACGDVASGNDWIAATPTGKTYTTGREAIRAATTWTGRVGRECIGRAYTVTGRGCTWSAYGLIPGPEFVVMPDGIAVPTFPIAPRPAEDGTP